MIIDYEIIWVEDGKMFFKRFSYEMPCSKRSELGYLPEDAYKFYDSLHKRNLQVVVAAGEIKANTGILRYTGAEPVN
jgi:hypothetical protein